MGGLDSKYGHVITELGFIPAEEPVVVFRGQDRLTPYVLEGYDALCRAAGASDDHLQDIAEALDAVIEWQSQNLTKTPDPIMRQSADNGQSLREILVSLSLADHPSDINANLHRLARILGVAEPAWSSRWSRLVWVWEGDRWPDRDHAREDVGSSG